jgi:hypothetical protein
MNKILFVFFLFVVGVAVGLPQGWPYRENHYGYYGYQQRGHHLVRSIEEDDERESGYYRQDLQVGGGAESSKQGQQTASAAVAAVQSAQPATVVVETGSAKPVAIDSTNKQVNAPVEVKQTSPNNAGVVQPPAFPPATPPPSPPPEDSSEEEDEDEEADDDDEDDEQDDDDDDDGRRRSDINGGKKNESAAAVVEALVPGYVTSQGEVLVPFDTVADKEKVVAVVEDPASSQVKPPVIVTPNIENQEQKIPKFFDPTQNPQIYYANVPPPGSIFTIDDDDDDEISSPPVVVTKRRLLRQDDDDDYDDTSADDESAQDDESQSQEEEYRRPPLSHVKATAPSGEDDELDSLGIRYRGFPLSRTPYYNGKYYGYVVPYGYQDEVEKPVVFYYRPVSEERVKVIPIGSFDVSIEETEEGVRPVIGPVRYHRPGYYSQGRPVGSRPVPVIREVVNKKQRYGTKVVRQRINKEKREANNEMKMNKKNVEKVKKDKLGLFKKNNENKKQ